MHVYLFCYTILPLCISSLFLWQKFYVQIIHGNMLLECCSLPDVRDEEWRGVRRGPNMLFLIRNNVIRIHERWK